MKQNLLLSGLIPILILLDQFSKWAVSELILRGSSGAPPVPLDQWITTPPPRMGYIAMEIFPFFNLVMVWNFGVSFGLFGDPAQGGAVILSAVAIAIALVFGVWMWRSASKVQSLALAMVIAGAIGNVIDRVRFGAVIDFLDFHAYGWHYPAFNFADSLIVVGIIALLIHNVFLEKSAHKSDTKD